MIELTEDARVAVDRSMEHQAAIGELFGSLSPADRVTLLRLTQELDNRMRAAASAMPGQKQEATKSL